MRYYLIIALNFSINWNYVYLFIIYYFRFIKFLKKFLIYCFYLFIYYYLEISHFIRIKENIFFRCNVNNNDRAHPVKKFKFKSNLIEINSKTNRLSLFKPITNSITIKYEITIN